MSSKTIRTCDECNGEIHDSEHYVNAGSYGADFHKECFAAMNAAKLVLHLGLDDIKYMKGDNWPESARLPGVIRSGTFQIIPKPDTAKR
jgi:hypothetical protein